MTAKRCGDCGLTRMVPKPIAGVVVWVCGNCGHGAPKPKPKIPKVTHAEFRRVQRFKERAQYARRRGGVLVPKKVKLPAVEGANMLTPFVNAACTALRLEPTMLYTNSRHKNIVLARDIVVAAARQKTTMSYPDIARAMQRPNHSTVVTSHRRTLAKLDLRLGELAVSDSLPAPLSTVTLGEFIARMEGAACS